MAAPRLCKSGVANLGPPFALAVSEDASMLYGTMAGGAQLRGVPTAGAASSFVLATAPPGSVFLGVALSPSSATASPSQTASSAATQTQTRTPSRTTSRAPAPPPAAAPQPTSQVGDIVAGVLVPVLVICGSLAAFALLRPKQFWAGYSWLGRRVSGVCGGDAGVGGYKYPSRVGERAPLAAPSPYGVVGSQL